MTWVGEIADELKLNVPGHDVLEVGSLDVNGSPRKLFDKVNDYVGIDMQAGPGVDMEAKSHSIPFKDDCFDVVVSTEMMEHDCLPWVSLAEMTRVCKEGGHVLVTARGYDHRGFFPMHSFPDDLYRYTVRGMAHMADWVGLGIVVVIADPTDPGVFLAAQKTQPTQRRLGLGAET